MRYGCTSGMTRPASRGPSRSRTACLLVIVALTPGLAARGQDAAPAATAEGDKAAAEEKGSRPGPLSVPPETEAVLKKRHPTSVADLKAIEEQVGRVVEYVLPATVGIQIEASAGSGVIVSEDGLVLTAGHVSAEPGRTAVVILLDGTRVRGKTLGWNADIDSGMIQIEEGGPFPYVTLAKRGEIEAGQWVVSAGHPGGYLGDRSPPIRLGRVLFENESVICTDCTLVGGDSGGPLFNFRGEVIGIHSRIGRQIRSNFHVPIATYLDTWERLLASEAWGEVFNSEQPARMRPLLGAAGTPGKSPCEVNQVFAGSAAARAGISVGDIIKSFDGEPVEKFGDLERLVLSRRIGQRIEVEVLREGETLALNVVLGGTARPVPGGSELDPNQLREEEEARRERERQAQPKFEDKDSDDSQEAPPDADPPESAAPNQPSEQPSESPPETVEPQPEPDAGEDGQAEPESPPEPKDQPQRDDQPQPEDSPQPEPRTDSSDAADAAAAEASADRLSVLAALGIEFDPVAIRPVVSRIIAASPAKRGGMQPGDIVARIGSVGMEESRGLAAIPWRQLLASIRGHQTSGGSTLMVTVLRAGSRIELELPLPIPHE